MYKTRLPNNFLSNILIRCTIDHLESFNHNFTFQTTSWYNKFNSSAKEISFIDIRDRDPKEPSMGRWAKKYVPGKYSTYTHLNISEFLLLFI